MILLHLVLVALYGLAAWTLWPAFALTHPAPQRHAAPEPRAAPDRWSRWTPWLVPAALVLHGWVAGNDIATPAGLDLGFDHALSVVAGLAALVAWASGLMRTLPRIGMVVLPVAGIFSLLPLLTAHTHRFSYTDTPWAAAHVAVALLAYALFIVAALQALVLMGLEKRLHGGRPDPAAVDVPPLLTLERYLFRLVGLGFLLLTLAVVSGIFFSEAIFGRPLTFNHKTVFSILSWLVFGALLLGRRRYGWRGRVALRWILTGTVLLLLAYLGSKFVLEVLLSGNRYQVSGIRHQESDTQDRVLAGARPRAGVLDVRYARPNVCGCATKSGVIADLAQYRRLSELGIDETFARSPFMPGPQSIRFFVSDA